MTPPGPGWDSELRKARFEIRSLAASLLNRELDRIRLGNGQWLIRDGESDNWSDPYAPTVWWRVLDRIAGQLAFNPARHALRDRRLRALTGF